MDPKKPAGSDGLTLFFFKTAAPVIAAPLTDIIISPFGRLNYQMTGMKLLCILFFLRVVIRLTVTGLYPFYLEFLSFCENWSMSSIFTILRCTIFFQCSVKYTLV